MKNNLNNNNIINNKDLIIWGENLPSSVGNKRLTKVEREMIKLPSFQRSVIIGLLLSDGWLTIASSTHKNARLGFKQSLARSSYVLFVFNFLSHYCGSLPNLVGGIREGNRYYAMQFFTFGMPCFTELHYLFYPDKKKIIPDNIYELLTPVALGHWIMGDGKVSRHGLIICTDSFSVEDVVRLMNVLIIKYRLECTLRFDRPNHPRIYICERSMSRLQTIVRSHTHSSMFYKLGLKDIVR